MKSPKERAIPLIKVCVPGTTTIPPPPDCTSDCTATIRITSVPGSPPNTVTSTVTGLVLGTTTIPPPPGCTTDCTATIRITTVPGSPESSTAESPVPDATTTTIITNVPGTRIGVITIPPEPGCTQCTATIRITTVPSQSPVAPSSEPSAAPSSEPPVAPSSEPSLAPSSEPSLAPSSEPPVAPSSEPSVAPSSEPLVPSSVESSLQPSATPSVVPTPEEACSFQAGTCGLTGLSLDLYNNSIISSEGYAVTDGRTGVGPDYYLSQPSLDTGSTNSLSVPTGDNNDATDTEGIRTSETRPRFTYYPGLTKTYGGMTFNANNFTMVFTGYFVPQVSGPHTFCVNFADNRDEFYLGSNTAFPCGDASNGATPPGAEPFVAYWFNRERTPQCATLDMLSGFYYPLRQVYGNWGSPSSVEVTVQGPDDEAPTADVSGRVSGNSCT